MIAKLLNSNLANIAKTWCVSDVPRSQQTVCLTVDGSQSQMP